MRLLTPVGVLLLLLGCNDMVPFSEGDGAPVSASTLVNLLNNKDVSWDGTDLGVQPTIKGTNALQVMSMGTNAVPYLLLSLAKPDRFVVAHVLLTKITLSTFPSDSTHWNLLPVDLLSDGHVVYGKDAQAMIFGYWHSRLAQ